ncbi:hypothetical protein PWT90_10409 [Aphanocladium album]|nr:hypothetical protein PWT90_10409 [Aphanocladium album]
MSSMSFRIIPDHIMRRISRMNQFANVSGTDDSNTNSDIPHTGKHNDDGHYDPSPIDVAVVRIMLAKATKLPVDIIDGIFELAQYWVHTVTAADYSDSPLSVSTHSSQNRFLVRSLPIGFTSEHGGDLDLKGQPAPAKHLHDEIPVKTLARMADYPLPKLQGPVRKIVFKFTSHDQGWSGENGGLYENSWTWFEAGLERLESSVVGAAQDPPPTALNHEALRPIHPTIGEVEPEQQEQAETEEKEDANQPEIKEKEEADVEKPQLEYKFSLLHDPKWTVSRNKRAHRDWQDHTITWACWDDVKPDSDAGKALEENGRGRETGDGEFVRNMKLGDVVTLWAKARFPGWINTIKAASIDVYWPARSARLQSTMSRQIQSKDGIPITLPEGLTETQLSSFKPFNLQTWMSTLSRSLALQSDAAHPFGADPYVLRSVTVQAFDLFGGARVGFVKLTAVVSNGAGESLPAAALLRGPSVAMLVMLIPDDDAPAGSDDERYVLFTVQPRVPAASLGFVELPAGMVDDAGNFKGVAAQEMQEELGITIAEEDLTCLSDLAAEGEETQAESLPAAMFPSAGGCDEHITIYSCERRIPRNELQSWSGRLTGLRDHGEKITLKIVPMKDAWRVGARDAKTLGALALWEGLRREGKV